MAQISQDLRHSVRVLLRNPGFTIVAVLTLALGIGACTSIFTVVNGVLLRPLPYPEPDRIARLFEISDKGNRMNVPQANFDDWKQQSRNFEQLAGYSGTMEATFLGAREPVRARTCMVSESFFPVLGATAQRGRIPLPTEHRAGAGAVAVVSHDFWQNALGSSADLEKVHLRYGNLSFTVVGVMPPGFSYPPGTQIWAPMEPFNPPNPSRSAHNWRVIGRLRPGVTPATAQAEVSAIARRIHEQYRDVTAVDAAVVPMHTEVTARVRPALLLLLGAVGALLLIACANVTNLQLAQATARERELAVRCALGASRWRLLRQSLTENALLAGAGAVCGVLLAIWGVDAMLALSPRLLPRGEEIHVDGWVLGFAIVVSMLTGVALGLAQAMRLRGEKLQDMLREGGRTLSGAARQRVVQGGLVVAQLGLTLVLLVGAGLLARSFWQTLQVDLGFEAGSQLAVEVLRPVPDTPEQLQQLARFHGSFQERIAALPGVTASGGINYLPLSGRGSNGRFLIEGGTSSGDYWPNFRVASPGYFAAMGIPLLSGRMFDSTDGPATVHVAVISKQVAERVWPGENPLGRRINYGNMDGEFESWSTIVGVVGDVRSDGPELGANGDIYLHYLQRPKTTASFTTVIRTSGDAQALTAAVRRLAQDLDPESSVSFRTLHGYFSGAMAERQFNLALVGVFGGTALLLAVMGIYGVMAYTVAQRTQEIGIRMALGAMGGDVVRQFLREGGRLIVIGIVLGLAGATALSKYIASLLFNTAPRDPWTFAAVAAAMALVALAACFIPARRATRVDPMVALRHE